MKQLLIIGARGWGREVYSAFRNCKEVKEGRLAIKGFLDGNADALKGMRGNFPPIICSPEDYQIQEDDVFFVAMGDPCWRKHYAEIIKSKGGFFQTYISSDENVLDTAVVGEGSFIGRWSSVSDNVTIGNHVIIHSLTVIGHDAVVKDYGTLLNAVFLGGYTEVGECSQMSPKSMIIPHKKIGDNVLVGAGSVVMRNFKDGVHVFGNPARKTEF